MPTVAVVTGSNKGIGFAIVRSLCKKLDSSDLVYLTSRSESLGLEAVKALEAEGLSPRYHQLDITDQESAERLRDDLQRAHGGIDILVHNAGIYLRYLDIPMKDKVERTLKTNYFDTLRTHHLLMPTVRPHGRIVFVASELGVRGYKRISDGLKKCFQEATAVEDVTKLMQKYESDVKEGIHGREGWKQDGCGYNISKLGIILVTKLLAAQLKDDPREGILINCANPGYVATDLNNHRGKLTIDEGAVSSVNLALLPCGVASPQGQCLDEKNQIQDFVGS